MGFAKFVLIRVAKTLAGIAIFIVFAALTGAFPVQVGGAVAFLCVAALLTMWVERAHTDYKGGKKP